MAADKTDRKNGRLYVVCYDIAEDSRRNKIAKLLEGYGRRIQYSVFECHLKEKDLEELYKSLSQLALDMEEGSIYIYSLCAVCEKKRLQIGNRDREIEELQEPVIII